MNKTDRELMAKYGITSKTKTIYSYKKHNYERLKDAINYAEIDINRHQQDSPNVPRVDEVDLSKCNDG